jgi:hypothetical protein
MAVDAAAPEAFALLDDLNTTLDKLAGCDLSTLTGEQLLAFTSDWERLKRRTSVLDHATVTELDSRHTAGEKGLRTTAALLAELLRLYPGQARRRVRDAGDYAPRHRLFGEPLPPLRPDTGRALADGDIGIEHARAVSDLFDAIPAQTLDAEQAIEGAALDAAAVCAPHRLRQWCVQAAARLDPDGSKPCEEAKRRERGLTLIDRPDGRAKISGRLTPHAAAALRAVLGPLAAPTPSTDDNIRDERTPAQRRHDALADACTRLLRTGTLPDTGGTASTILVTIDYRDLLHRYWQHTHSNSAGNANNTGTHGTGSTDADTADSGNSFGARFATNSFGTTSFGTDEVATDSVATDGFVAGCGDDGFGFAGTAGGHAVTSYGTLIPIDELLRRAGDAHLIPVILNDTGGILAYGRSRRLASPGQRRALAARDGGCVRPGCTIPADWCEVHHLTPWQYGGRTDLDQLALVCGHDHDELDRGATLTMINGVPHWIEPPHLDPHQTPRRNTAHHIPRILTHPIAAPDP